MLVLTYIVVLYYIRIYGWSDREVKGGVVDIDRVIQL